MAIGSVINVSSLSLTFDDEFNTFNASADGSTGLWRTTLVNGDRTLGSNGEEEYYSDSSVGVNPFSIQNGILDITAAPGSNPLKLPYNSGVITTENSFNQLYGYFEIDAKLPAGQGLWPAFWMVPADGAWPPELDTFEVLGNNPTTLYFSTHSADQPTQGTTLNVANVSSGFNLYGVMWGPQTVDLYINNVEVASMPTPADMDVPMYMLANLAVGGYWPGDPNSSTQFPATMEIDYIRAYAYPGTTGGTVYDTLASQNVGPAALAPVISAPAKFQATVGAATPVGGVSVAANWPGGFFTVVISDSSGLLNTTATADVFTSGEGTNSITLTGNLAPINSALATLTYQGQSAGSEWIWIDATDPQGLQSQTPVVAADAVGTTPPPVVTPPVVTPPAAATPAVTTAAALTLAAGTTAAVTGVSVADSNASGNFIVRVSDSTGLLSTTAVGGVTAQGEGTTGLTLTGTLAAVNAGLATLTYHAGKAAGTDWLWVSANDASGDQGLGHDVVTVTVPPATTPPAASPPVVTTPATMSLAAGATQALTGISVADSQASGTFTVRVSDSTGLLSTTAVGGVTAQGEGTTSLALTGTLAAINAELTGLTYQAGTAAGTDWLWVSANDTSGGQGLSHEVVTVTPVPVVTTPATMSLAARATQALTGISVADANASGTFTVRVSDTTGLLNTTAITGVTAQGEGTTALALTGTLAAINAELASLTYHAGKAAGTDWLWVSANDASGAQGLSHEVVTVTPLPVTPVTPVPVVTTPATMTLAAGATQALTGVSVADSQAAGAFTVRVSDSTGLLSTTAVSGVIAQGEGTTGLSLTGTLAAINTELVSLTYHAGAAGTDWLWVSANDANGGQGLSHEVVTVTSAAVSLLVQAIASLPSAGSLQTTAPVASAGVSETTLAASSALHAT